MSDLSERERDILRRAADIIDSRGIHYGGPLADPANPNDCSVCVLTALSLARGLGLYGWFYLDVEETHLVTRLASRIDSRISDDRPVLDVAKVVYEWNDIDMPTAAEAAALLREVAA